MKFPPHMQALFTQLTDSYRMEDRLKARKIKYDMIGELKEALIKDYGFNRKVAQYIRDVSLPDGGDEAWKGITQDLDMEAVFYKALDYAEFLRDIRPFL